MLNEKPMKKPNEKEVQKYQWPALLIGILLLIGGFYLMWKGSSDSLLCLVGALGWLGLALMMSPQVRSDLFGTRFEASRTETES